MNFDYCNGTIYVIKQGDTLYSISRKYNVPLAMILRSNPYADIYNLKVGDEICIPQTQPMSNCIGPNCTSNPMSDEPEATEPAPSMPMQPNEMRPPMEENRVNVNSFAISSPGENNTNTPISQLKPAAAPAPRAEGEGVPRTDQTVWSSKKADNTFEEEQMDTMNLGTYRMARNRRKQYSSTVLPNQRDQIPQEPGPVEENPNTMPAPNPRPGMQNGGMPMPGGQMPNGSMPMPGMPMPNGGMMAPQSGRPIPRPNGGMPMPPAPPVQPLPGQNPMGAGPRQGRENLISYVIRNGDTIQSILNYFSITMDEFVLYNRPGTVLLKEGYVVQIPASSRQQEEY